MPNLINDYEKKNEVLKKKNAYARIHTYSETYKYTNMTNKLQRLFHVIFCPPLNTFSVLVFYAFLVTRIHSYS